MKLNRGEMVKFNHEGNWLAGRVGSSGEKRSKVAVDGTVNDGNFAIYSVVNAHTEAATPDEVETLLHQGPIPEETIEVAGCHRC